MANDETQFELDLPFTSFYKETPLYIRDGVAFFGRWRPPTIQLDGDEERVIVDGSHVGDLNRYAYEYYGDASLWKAIAHVNQINYPIEEVVQGLTLIIPKIENVFAALQAAEDRQNSGN